MYNSVSLNPVLDLTTDMWEFFMNNGFTITVGESSFTLSYGIILLGTVAIGIGIDLIHKIWDW